MAEAYLDWATHLAYAPGKRLQLADKATRKSVRLANYLARNALQADGSSCCIEPLPQDHRFDAPEWKQWPYNLIHQSFLLNQQWWHNATTGIRGVTKQHENVVEFAARQMLDMVSPANFLATNPELMRRTAGDRRHEPGAGHAQHGRGLGAHDQRPQAGRAPRISRSAATSRSRPARSSIAIA